MNKEKNDRASSDARFAYTFSTRPVGFAAISARGSHMGVGVQGEAREEVAEHAVDGFDVHTVLQRQRGKGVAQIVETVILMTLAYIVSASCASLS